MRKVLYIGIAIEVIGNGLGGGLQMTGYINLLLGWIIIGISTIGGLALIILGCRKKGDKSSFEEQKKSLIPTIDFHTYEFGLSGYKRYPKEPNEVWWLKLEISIDHINRSIDTLDLVIEGESIPVNLPCKFSHIFHGYFNVSKWRDTSKHQVELRAKVGNEPISSGRKLIDFNMEIFWKTEV